MNSHEIIVPPVYRTPKLLKFILGEIEDSPLGYYKTPLEFRQIAIKILLDEMDKDVEDDLYMLFQSDPTILMHHLKCYLETGSKEFAVDLAESLSDAAYKYFEPVIHKLYDEILDEYKADCINNWVDYSNKRKVNDPINGELKVI